MNFKGHKQIQSGILKKIPTRWYESIPKDLEEACCFCFACFVLFTAFWEENKFLQSRNCFHPIPGHSICDRNWIWKGHGKEECLTSHSISLFSFRPDFFLILKQPTAAITMSIINSYDFLALRFMLGIMPAYSISSLCMPFILNHITGLWCSYFHHPHSYRGSNSGMERLNHFLQFTGQWMAELEFKSKPLASLLHLGQNSFSFIGN